MNHPMFQCKMFRYIKHAKRGITLNSVKSARIYLRLSRKATNIFSIMFMLQSKASIAGHTPPCNVLTGITTYRLRVYCLAPTGRSH